MLYQDWWKYSIHNSSVLRGYLIVTYNKLIVSVSALFRVLCLKSGGKIDAEDYNYSSRT